MPLDATKSSVFRTVLNDLNLAANPLVMRGIRTRLRLPAAISAGLVTITFASFLYAIVYMSAVNNVYLPEDATPEQHAQLVRTAAKSAIPALIIMQGIILMVMGTGAAAGGIARERSDRLLDYHRLTPMPPHAKIIGLLFGLPIREYFMFAITLPFVGYAAYKGQVPFDALLQFYIVFITSCWLYHLTGMVSGMIVDRPWRAGFVVQAMVIGLYIFLPQLSNFGLTSFEFLTARPAFVGIVQQHLLSEWSEIESVSQGFAQSRDQLEVLRWKSIAFFNLKLHPLIFSLIVQGFMLGLLFTVIYRKWQGIARLPLSKFGGLLFFALLQVLVLGSLLGLLWDQAEFLAMVNQRGGISGAIARGEQWVIWRFAFVTLGVSGVAGAMLLHLIMPTWHQQVNALRKARRRGMSRLPLLSDAASPWPVALGVIVMSVLAFGWIILEIHRLNRLPGGPDMNAAMGAAAFLAIALAMVFLLREQVSAKLFTMLLFVFWLIPLLIAIVVFFAITEQALGVLAGLPSPITPIYLYTVLIVHDPTGEIGAFYMLPDEVAPLAWTYVLLITTAYAIVMVGLAVTWTLRRKRLHLAAFAESSITPPIEPHRQSPPPPAAD